MFFAELLSPPCARAKTPPDPLQAPGSMALPKVVRSCLAAEDLIHHFPVIEKVRSNNPKLRPMRSQLSSKTSGRSWHFPTSCLVFPSHALAYLQAFKFLKGRAGLYYASGQCLTQEGPSLIRVSSDYRNTNTANKMHLNEKKAVTLLFQSALTLGKSGGGGLVGQRHGGPTSHPGAANPVSCPCRAANPTEQSRPQPCDAFLCPECFAHPNVPPICLPEAGPASLNSN